MKSFKIALVALVAASSILPMLNSPAEARVRLYKRVYNSAYYNPYARYSAQVEYNQRHAAANSLINQVNAMIQSGQLTVQQGNQILVQGHF